MSLFKHLKYKGGWQTPEKIESLSKSVPIRSLINFKKTKRKKRRTKNKKKKKKRKQTKKRRKRKRKRRTRYKKK
tara:strand:+ start:207 stop:428 length:222 start_codon:yes stop_codon:yes gene_type:complete